MKPNALRGAVAVIFLIVAIGAYLLGKAAGEREANSAAAAAAQAGGQRGSGAGGSLSALGGGVERPGGSGGSRGSGEADLVRPYKKPTVKSIIGRASRKMQGGMMNLSGIMRSVAMLDEISDDELLTALDEVERSIKEPQKKMMFAMMLLGRWAEIDGPAALAYAEKNYDDGNPMMQQVKMSVVSSWAQGDPDAAWDWYVKQEDDGKGGRFGGKRMSLMGIFGSLATKDVDKAFERLATLEDQQERQVALQGLGQAIWDENSRAEILAKVASMEDENERRSTQSSIVSQWAQIDPDAALDWTGSLGEDERSAAVKQIAQSLAWSDPKRSGELLLSEAKTPEERAQAYANTVSSWAFSDANGAGEWLREQEQGPELDQARQQFANSVAQKDPLSAMAWANAVTDEGKRGQAVQGVYMQWRSSDPEAADAGLATTDLSAEKVAELKAMEVPKHPQHSTIFQTTQIRSTITSDETEAIQEAIQEVPAAEELPAEQP